MAPILTLTIKYNKAKTARNVYQLAEGERAVADKRYCISYRKEALLLTDTKATGSQR